MMAIEMSSNRIRLAFFTLVFVMILIPFHTTFAQNSEGITISKDVFLQGPIQSPEDLPDEVTFSLYDSEDALVPLATQSFPRGEYVLDFDFNKSDGLLSGSVARFKVNFTNKLNLDTDAGDSKQPKEIWVEFSVNDDVVGNRTCVPDEAMVQLLLASDASIATYLTLAYEGDDNPITTIYRDLPLSSLNLDSSETNLSDYFSTLPTTVLTGTERAAENWVDSGANVYTFGNVGIGTTSPELGLDIKDIAAWGTPLWINASGLTGGKKWSIQATGGTHGNGQGLLLFRNETDAKNVMTFAGDTSVGIGTTSPAAGLELKDIAAWGTPFWLDASGLTGGKRWSIQATGGTHGDGQGLLLFRNETDAKNVMTFSSTSVAVGSINSSYDFAVNGTIGCKELTVTTSGWADFVFEDNYKLPSLNEVALFISENRHLPGIPTETQVKDNGVNVGEISARLLQKVEELTLYMINLKRENESLKAQMAHIQRQVNKNNP